MGFGKKLDGLLQAHEVANVAFFASVVHSLADSLSPINVLETSPANPLEETPFNGYPKPPSTSFLPSLNEDPLIA